VHKPLITPLEITVSFWFGRVRGYGMEDEACDVVELTRGSDDESNLLHQNCMVACAFWPCKRLHAGDQTAVRRRNSSPLLVEGVDPPVGKKRSRSPEARSNPI